MILESMAHACRHILEEDDEPAPTTISEFSHRFAPYERQMQEFLDKVTNGVYASIGLTAAMIPADPALKVEPIDTE